MKMYGLLALAVVSIGWIAAQDATDSKHGLITDNKRGQAAEFKSPSLVEIEIYQWLLDFQETLRQTSESDRDPAMVLLEFLHSHDGSYLKHLGNSLKRSDWVAIASRLFKNQQLGMNAVVPSDQNSESRAYNPASGGKGSSSLLFTNIQ